MVVEQVTGATDYRHLGLLAAAVLGERPPAGLDLTLVNYWMGRASTVSDSPFSFSLSASAMAVSPVISNAGFEAPAVGGSFQYNPSGGSWTFAGGTGVSGNGSGFTAGNPAAPEGQQVAFLQGDYATISQAINNLQPGASY